MSSDLRKKDEKDISTALRDFITRTVCFNVHLQISNVSTETILLGSNFHLLFRDFTKRIYIPEKTERNGYTRYDPYSRDQFCRNDIDSTTPTKQCILNAFYWYQILAIDYVVVKVQNCLAHMGASYMQLLQCIVTEIQSRIKLSESVRCRIFQRCWNGEKAGMNR